MLLYNEILPKKLSAEEEQRYCEEMRAGNLEARIKLIEHNMRLVIHIVGRYAKDQEEFDEYCSLGYLGLIKAIDTYDLNCKIKISTYAGRCIENEILAYHKKIQKYALNISLNTGSVVEDDDNDFVLQDTLYDRNIDILDIVESKEIKNDIHSASNVLSEIEAKVITLYFGLEDGNNKVQTEISEILHISQRHVSRIYLRSLQKLKIELERNYGYGDISSFVRKRRLKLNKN